MTPAPSLSAAFLPGPSRPGPGIGLRAHLGLWVLLLNLLVFAIAGYALHAGWRASQARAETATQNLARLIERDIGSTLDKIDIALHLVTGELERQLARGVLDRQALARVAERELRFIPEANRVAVFDAGGNLVLSHGVGAAVPPTIADRDYFVALRQDPRDRVLVTAPVVGRMDGAGILLLTHAVVDHQGRFAGVVNTAVTLQSIKDRFATLDLGAGGAVSLRHTDRTLLVRHPGPIRMETEEDNRRVSSELVAALAARPVEGSYRAATAIDGIERANFYRRFERYPFYVIVGLATRDFLVDWRQDVFWTVSFVCLFAVVTVSMSFLLLTYWRRQASSFAALEESLQRQERAAQMLRERDRLLAHAESIAKVGSWKVRFGRDGAPDEWTLSDLLRRLFGHPDRDPMSSEAVVRLIAPEDRARMIGYWHEAKRGAPMPPIEHRGQVDGETHWFLVNAQPDVGEDGSVIGVSGTTQDITERKRAEQARHEAHERLRRIASRVPGVVFQFLLRADGTACVPYASEGIRDTFGVESQAVLEDAGPVFAALHPEDLPGFREAIGHSAKSLSLWQREFRVLAPDGSERWLRGEASPALQADGSVLWHGYIGDVTERKRAEQRIQVLAFFDSLTGLPNRRLLQDRLEQLRASSGRTRRRAALLYLDLDHFKNLNDTKGHDVGDQLLVQVAGRLLASVRQSDTVARLGGDEFVILLGELDADPVAAAEQAATMGREMLRRVAEPYDLHGSPGVPVAGFRISASIGIHTFLGLEESVGDLLKHADLAMYQAKAAGRNAVRLFAPSMQEAVERHEAIVTALRLAIARQQFVLHYQPQFDVQGRCVAVEALLRWNHPERGLQHPAAFLREAEETGLIEPIGQWVIGQALAQQARWSRRPGFEGLRMSVNVSARQFRGGDFVKAVARALDANATAPGRLTLELTESILLDSPEEAGARMQALRELGVNLALDDFGTGYSSLSYLTRLPLDEIKIDRAFVSRMEHESGEAAIVQAILAVAIRLSLRVVAEGVETEAQLRQLKLHGCNLFQGYLLGRPMDAAALEAALAETRLA